MVNGKRQVMNTNGRHRVSIFDLLNVVGFIIFSMIMIYPLLYVFSVSISDSYAITLGKVWLWPVGFDLTAYEITFTDPDIWLAYRNTIIYAVLGTLTILVVNTMIAYALAQKEFFLRKALTVYYAITMFFSGGLIPTYLLVQSLGMLDTIWVMIIPGCASAWTIIVFRTNFQQLPESLTESAKIDGANALRVYWKIVLPMSGPIIATIALFSVVGIWNSYFNALVYLSETSRFPLQLFLRNLIVSARFDSQNMQESIARQSQDGKGTPGLIEGIKMAAIVVSMGPILLAYPFVQKYFVKGVLVGSIKG